MEQDKRPNRHSNPSKQHVRNRGRFQFFRNKNRKAKELLRAMA